MQTFFPASKARTFYAPLPNLRKPNVRDLDQSSGIGSISVQIDVGMR